MLWRRSFAGDVSQKGLVGKGTSHAETGNARRVGITHCTPGEQRKEPGAEGDHQCKGQRRAGIVGAFEAGSVPRP